MNDIDKAPHTDVERLAASLDAMVSGASAIGVKLPRVEAAAEMLRRLSQMLYALQHPDINE